jgi:hypothetical protein
MKNNNELWKLKKKVRELQGDLDFYSQLEGWDNYLTWLREKLKEAQSNLETFVRK